MTGAWFDKAQYPVDLVQVRAQVPVLQRDVMMSMVVVREHRIHNGWYFTRKADCVNDGIHM